MNDTKKKAIPAQEGDDQGDANDTKNYVGGVQEKKILQLRIILSGEKSLVQLLHQLVTLLAIHLLGLCLVLAV